jgi:hypothetical protein
MRPAAFVHLLKKREETGRRPEGSFGRDIEEIRNEEATDVLRVDP